MRILEVGREQRDASRKDLGDKVGLGRGVAALYYEKNSVTLHSKVSI